MNTAVFSIDRKHRYILKRKLAGNGPTVSIGMVNPSIAAEDTNDQTITKVIGFCDRMNASSLTVWNLCAAVATNIRDLKHMADPVGPDNDSYIRLALEKADIHIVAWGPLNKLPKPLRGRRLVVTEIARQLGIEFQCWDVALDGQPKHPLMLPYSLQLKPWSPV